MNILRKAGALLLTAALAVSLGMTVLPVTAGAGYEDSGTGGNSLRVHFTPGGNRFTTDLTQTTVQRQGYRLYKVADINETKDGFTLTEAFSDLQGTPIPTTLKPQNAFQVLTDNSWTLIQRVGSYVNTRSPEPDYAAVFVDGVATFTNLPDGLYLGTGPQARYGRTIYTPTPFLLCLPYQVTENDTVPEGSDVQPGVLYKDLNVTIKYTQETYTNDNDGGGGSRNPNNPTPPPNNPDNPTNPPSDNPPSDNPPSDNPTPDGPIDIPDEDVPLANLPDEPSPTAVLPDMPVPQAQLPSNPPSPTAVLSDKPKLPQTGALWWPVPLMGGSGGLLMCAGLLGRRKNK